MRRTSVLRGSAPLGDDHFEIFARDDQRAVIGDVEIVDQRVEIRLERLAGRRVLPRLTSFGSDRGHVGLDHHLRECERHDADQRVDGKRRCPEISR
jgi:hypothetical protein